MATGKRETGRPSHLSIAKKGSDSKSNPSNEDQKEATPATAKSGGSSGGASVTKREPRLPGMTGNSIKEIDQAGAALLEVQDRKKAILKEEKTANETVVAIMKKKKRDYYCYDQLEVWLEPGKLKAKAKHKAAKKA